MAVAIVIADGAPDGLDLAPLDAVMVALNTQLEPETPAGDVVIAFVDDETMRELNRDYSGNDYATDVLSFSYIEDGGEPIEGTLGDIAISLPTAERQAKIAETGLSTEVALLGLHGVLHILGYDHADDAERVALDALQGGLMKQAGLTYRDFKWDL
jgi:probable rRNA maturation factor